MRTLSLGSSKPFHRSKVFASKTASLPGVLAAPAAPGALASTYVAVCVALGALVFLVLLRQSQADDGCCRHMFARSPRVSAVTRSVACVALSKNNPHLAPDYNERQARSRDSVLGRVTYLCLRFRLLCLTPSTLQGRSISGIRLWRTLVGPFQVLVCLLAFWRVLEAVLWFVQVCCGLA